jgi:iron(III) transport system substrate-binding protein
MHRTLQSILILSLIILLFGQTRSLADESSLTLYAGRSKSLVQPLIELFEKQTGIKVNIKYGNTAQLALALSEEGDRSPADVYWAQDAGALGAVDKAGLFGSIPSEITDRLPANYRHDGGNWIATSGRARVLAYSNKVDENALPKSVFDLTDDRYRGRVGWAPANASFQSFVTALRKLSGEEAAEAWLRAMKANDAKSYPKNTAIIQGIASGEVDYGIPNHYYLLRFKKGDSKFPVEQTFFADGDPGNLVNIAGVGILKTAKHRDAALTFVRFLISPAAQQYFCSDVFEYPVTDDVVPNARLADLATLQLAAPTIALGDLDDLAGTLALLRKVGLL